ncbi:MAG: hypothetical protein M1457_03495 [bacterium]|nr:hypothetical protein [bacterium]
MTSLTRPPWVRAFWRQLYWLLPALAYAWAVALAPRATGIDCFPTPDAEEYALLANRLAAGAPPLIGIGLNDYPSRYPLAYPLLLTPFAWICHFDITRYHWAASFYGLLAVVLMARVGAWMLGSRAAGGLAAMFWAWHPETVRLATVNMSETALTMMIFGALALARPWLTERRDESATAARRSGWRGGALGLALAWLTLAKAPFAWWALALTAIIAGQAMVDRRYRALAALTAVGAGCAAGDLLYRRWAFGQWGMNGYQYWFPGIYDSVLATFNWKYLFNPWLETMPEGNLVHYGRMVLGRTYDFYSGYMAATAGASLACLLWPWRRGRPSGTVVTLMGGWGIVGVAFCGLYFYQEERFPFLWIPVVDMLAAWGLAQAWTWVWLRRGWRRRIKANQWGRLICVAVAFILVRGEYRRIEPILASSDREPTARTIERLLAKVPEGAWVFGNYEVPLVDQYRATPGPTGALYIYLLDGFQNGFPLQIESLDLRPHGPRRDARRWAKPVPAAWRTGPTALIDMDDQWLLTPEERREIFARPVYLLVVRPRDFPLTEDHLREVVWPMLDRETTVETIQTRGHVTLYRGLPRVPGHAKTLNHP